MTGKGKIVLFTDLYAWQEAHRLALLVYQETKDFPRQEMFGLTSQMRRSALSVTSNVSEGFSRKTSREKIRFYSIASGSLNELQNQLILATDVGFMTKDKFNQINIQTVTVHKLINGLIRYSRKPVILNTDH